MMERNRHCGGPEAGRDDGEEQDTVGGPGAGWDDGKEDFVPSKSGYPELEPLN